MIDCIFYCVFDCIWCLFLIEFLIVFKESIKLFKLVSYFKKTISNLEKEILKLKFEIWIWKLKFENLNLKFEIKIWKLLEVEVGNGSYWKLKVENGSWKLEVGRRSYWKLKLEVGSWNFKFQISNLKIENWNLNIFFWIETIVNSYLIVNLINLIWNV